MSHEATNWAVKQKKLRPIAKIVLWHLADCHNPTQGCFPTQEYLADMAEVSRASVNRILSELEHGGIIRREIRLHPETKRRISTRYRLAFEKDFEPLHVGPDVTGCDMAPDADPCLKNDDSHVSKSAVSMSHSCETQTSKGTSNLTGNPPQPPENGGLGFAGIWEVWPSKYRGRRDNAEGAYNSLPKTEKRAASELAPTVITAMTRQGKRIPALVSYFRKRLFSDYLDAPEIDTDGHFVIKPGMAEWNEWAGWARRQGGEKGVERLIKQGYLLTKTRWPEPAADEAAA
jgi:DNA-binding MarR family transcriptional regulator